MKIGPETGGSSSFWRNALGIELLDFSVDYQDDGQRGHQRRAVRVHLPGLTAWVPEREAFYPVFDLSTFGLAFKDNAKSFQTGQTLTLDVHVQGKVWVVGLDTKVVMVRDDVLVACTFPNMTRLQEQRMDKLSLEIQKRWIKIRKLQKQQGEDEANSS